jgi:hypothetical protein
LYHQICHKTYTLETKTKIPNKPPGQLASAH